MCGRYTLATPVEALEEEFGVGGPVPELVPSFNVAPAEEVAVVQGEGGDRRLELLRWGLVPFWADDPGIGQRMINARAETAPEKPAFRAAFRKRRCLIPADGFYEWQRADGGPKQPFHIRRRDGHPFAFAGIWEDWRDGEVRSCAILTTDANEELQQVHHRMPVILDREDYGRWLDPEAGERDLQALLQPYAANDLEFYPVDRRVNKPSNDDPRCIEPVA